MLRFLANNWRNKLTQRPSASATTHPVRFSSSYFLRTPPKSAPRECPTPLVFVSARAWDEDSARGMTTLSSMLSEQGFTCLQTDLALPDPQTRSNSSSLMKWFEGGSSHSSIDMTFGNHGRLDHSELRSAICLSMIPFPPVVFGRSASCLIAQTYISSNPATGLFLLWPPVHNTELESARGQDGLPVLPTRLVEFDFEPFFPIAVMATSERMELLMSSNRLAQDSEVDKYAVQSLEGQQTYNNIQSWLDKIGI